MHKSQYFKYALPVLFTLFNKSKIITDILISQKIITDFLITKSKAGGNNKTYLMSVGWVHWKSHSNRQCAQPCRLAEYQALCLKQTRQQMEKILGKILESLPFFSITAFIRFSRGFSLVQKLNTLVAVHRGVFWCFCGSSKIPESAEMVFIAYQSKIHFKSSNHILQRKSYIRGNP